MKKQSMTYSLIISLFLMLGLCAKAQDFVTVSGTIVDSDSQVWFGGSWSAQLNNPRGGPVNFIDGTTPVVTQFSGSLDGFGTFSQSNIPNNAALAPSGTFWTFRFCPYSSAGCTAMPNVSFISGQTTFDISTLATANIIAPRFSALGHQSWGYADGEISTIPNPGGIYFNVTLALFRYWNGTIWVSLTGGGGTCTDCVLYDPTTVNRPPNGDQTIVQLSGSTFTLEDLSTDGLTFTPVSSSGCGIDSLIGCPEFYMQLSQDGSFGAGHYSCGFDFEFYGQDINCWDTEDNYQINYEFEGDTFQISGNFNNTGTGGLIEYDPENGFIMQDMPGFIVFTSTGNAAGFIVSSGSPFFISPYLEVEKSNTSVSGTLDWGIGSVLNITGTTTLPSLGTPPVEGILQGTYIIYVVPSGTQTLNVASGDTINGSSSFSLTNPSTLLGDSFTRNWSVIGGGSSNSTGTVTNIATTGPITGGPITTTGTIACATCVTSATALTNNAVVIGGGLQAASTISADTTTTHALFATAGAPAFRAILSSDIPTLNQSTTGNAATATNLASYPTLCSGGQFSQGLSSGSNNCATPSGGGSGTVTSVAETVPSGFAVSGTPITTSGTLGITYSVAAAGEIIDSSAVNTAGFTATPILGASGTLGSLTLGNATSGLITIVPVTGALGTVTASLPANTGIIAELNLAQTFSALQTYSAGINLSGTTSPLEVAGSAGTSGNCFISGGAGVTPSWSSCGSASLVFPITVSGTTTSGGIPYFSATTTLTSSGILNTGFLVKGGGAGGAPTNSLCDEGHTTANVLTCTDTGGFAFTGTAQNMGTLSSTSVNGTQLTLNNSTSGAHNFSIFTSGSGQGVGYLDLYDDTTGGLMTAFHCPTSSLCTETGIGEFVRGWQTGSVLNGTIDTGESRDSAGVVDFGNGTYQDKSGTINAAVVSAGSFNGVHLGKSQLTSTYTNATATPSTIWSFVIVPSTNYQITCTGIYKTASGGAFELTATSAGTPTNFSYSFRPTVGLVSNVPSDLVYAATGTSYPSGINATAVTTAATDMPFIIEFNLNNGSIGGTLAIQGNTISTNTLTVETGSTCTIN